MYRKLFLEVTGKHWTCIGIQVQHAIETGTSPMPWHQISCCSEGFVPSWTSFSRIRSPKLCKRHGQPREEPESARRSGLVCDLLFLQSLLSRNSGCRPSNTENNVQYQVGQVGAVSKKATCSFAPLNLSKQHQHRRQPAKRQQRHWLLQRVHTSSSFSVTLVASGWCCE